jgi:hypothetical protein
MWGREAVQVTSFRVVHVETLRALEQRAERAERRAEAAEVRRDELLVALSWMEYDEHGVPVAYPSRARVRELTDKIDDPLFK